MTKKDLLELIKDLPDDTLIVMSSDGEGNQHSPLSDGYSAMYVADSTWSGEVYGIGESDPEDDFDDEEPEEDDEEWECDEDDEDEGVPCFVLCPTN